MKNIKELYFKLVLVGVGVLISMALIMLSLNGTTNKAEMGNFTSYFKGDEQVVVYGLDTCRFCAKTKQYLEDKKIKYVFIEISKDKKGQEEYKKFNVETVPVIIFKNQKIVGYDPALLDKAITKQK